MIYVFGKKENISIVMKGEKLSEDAKKRATLAVEHLPKPEKRDGYYPYGYVNPETKEFEWRYEKIKEEVIENETE